MISLTSPLTDYVIFEGRKIKLNVSFDNVIRMYDIFRDDFLSNTEKYEFALALLCRGRFMPKLQALDVIFHEQLETFGKSGNNRQKVVDFKQDAPYIYSSFMLDYGIDLIEMQGKLHWQKFIALFHGLSEKTKMREVMSIRSKPIPKPDKYNQEYIRNLMELKAFYALEISQEERERNFKEGLRQLAQTLVARAEMR